MLRDVDYGQTDHVAAESTHGPHHSWSSSSWLGARGPFLATVQYFRYGGSRIHVHLEYIHRESSQKSTRIAPPERYRGRSSPTPPAHETSMPPSPPKPTSRRPREAHERRASSSWSWLLPQPRTLRLRHLCAQSSFLARHAAARVTGASARPRSACEIAPRHTELLGQRCVVHVSLCACVGSRRLWIDFLARLSAENGKPRRT